MDTTLDVFHRAFPCVFSVPNGCREHLVVSILHTGCLYDLRYLALSNVNEYIIKCLLWMTCVNGKKLGPSFASIKDSHCNFVVLGRKMLFSSLTSFT